MLSHNPELHLLTREKCDIRYHEARNSMMYLRKHTFIKNSHTDCREFHNHIAHYAQGDASTGRKTWKDRTRELTRTQQHELKFQVSGPQLD